MRRMVNSFERVFRSSFAGVRDVGRSTASLCMRDDARGHLAGQEAFQEGGRDVAFLKIGVVEDPPV